MNRSLIYQLMARKWFEIAERAEPLALKQCYMKRAQTYRAMTEALSRDRALEGGREATKSGIYPRFIEEEDDLPSRRI